MKRNLKNLFLILALAMPFVFTSCSDDDDSAQITIAFNQSGVFASGDAIVGTITSIEENLTKVVILLDGNAVKTYTSFSSLPIQKGDNGVYAVFISDITAVGEYTLRAESKTGESSKAFTIEGDESETSALDAATAFEWKRVGAADATGLSDFGLSWTSNTSTVAIISQDDATKFVQLAASTWTSIETKEALAAAVEAATAITRYDGVSVTASSTYNDVLAVKKGDEYLIIHVTNATVATGTSTTITITGEYKK